MPLEVVIPVFIAIGIGYLVGKFRRIDPEPLAELVIYALSPCLIFYSLVSNPLSVTVSLRIVVFYFLLVLLLWAVATVFGIFLRLDKLSKSALKLSIVGMNTGSYGLPVILFAFGENALSPGVLVMICTSITSATLGVYFAAGGSSERLDALTSVFKIPLVYAVVAAFTVIWSGYELPETLLRATELIGKPALPVGLLILGIQFSRMKISRDLEIAGVAIGAKLILAPVLALIILEALSVTGLEKKVLLIQAGMPTAIGSLTLSLRFGAKPELVSAAILGSTLLSLVTTMLLVKLLI